MAATENRLRYAAALMLAAEQADLNVFARPDGRVFVSGDDSMVKRMQPEMCRFKTEISYLLNHTRMQADAMIKRVRCVPAARRQKLRRQQGETK